MEKSSKYIKPILQSLKTLINQHGGNPALSNPYTVAKIKEDLTRLNPGMSHEDFKLMGDILQTLNSNN